MLNGQLKSIALGEIRDVDECRKILAAGDAEHERLRIEKAGLADVLYLAEKTFLTGVPTLPEA